MGLFDFVKEAGEKIFGGGEEEKQAAEAERSMQEALADKSKGESLTKLLGGMGFVEDADVKFREGKATICGTADCQADKEKAILLVGNTHGVAQVDDQIKLEKPEPEAKMHTVVSGDTLGKISKNYYGDAMKYMTIFEANKPLLKDPDKIYVGQVLRIPNLED